MHGGKGAGGDLHRHVVARMQGEDRRRRRIATLDRLAGQQQPACELVAEVLLHGTGGGGASRLPTITTLVEEAVRELVGDQEPPALPVEPVAQAGVDVVPTPPRGWVDRDVETVAAKRDQQGLRSAAIRVELGTLHRETVLAQPCLEIPQWFVRVLSGQGFSDLSGDKLRRVFLGAGAGQGRQTPRRRHPGRALDHHRDASPSVTAGPRRKVHLSKVGRAAGALSDPVSRKTGGWGGQTGDLWSLVREGNARWLSVIRDFN